MFPVTGLHDDTRLAVACHDSTNDPLTGLDLGHVLDDCAHRRAQSTVGDQLLLENLPVAALFM